MRRLGFAVLLGALTAPPAVAQARPARSMDYLFVATADGVRASWPNPAGLAVLPEASVMLEFLFEQPPVGDAHVGQWSAGFSSRGLSLLYQRDRYRDEPSTNALRMGLGLPFERGALGAAVTLYNSEQSDRGFDIGLRYALTPMLDAAAVVRHIGRPVMRGAELPVTGVVGLGWVPVRRLAQFAAEVHLAEQPGGSWEVGYRAGVHVASGGRFPVGAVAAVDLHGSAAVHRVSVGIVLGGLDRAVLLGSTTVGNEVAGVEQVSVTAVATRRRPGTRP